MSYFFSRQLDAIQADAAWRYEVYYRSPTYVTLPEEPPVTQTHRTLSDYSPGDKVRFRDNGNNIYDALVGARHDQWHGATVSTTIDLINVGTRADRVKSVRPESLVRQGEFFVGELVECTWAPGRRCKVTSKTVNAYGFPAYLVLFCDDNTTANCTAAVKAWVEPSDKRDAEIAALKKDLALAVNERLQALDKAAHLQALLNQIRNLTT